MEQDPDHFFGTIPVHFLTEPRFQKYSKHRFEIFKNFRFPYKSLTNGAWPGRQERVSCGGRPWSSDAPSELPERLGKSADADSAPLVALRPKRRPPEPLPTKSAIFKFSPTWGKNPNLLEPYNLSDFKSTAKPTTKQIEKIVPKNSTRYRAMQM